MITDINCDYCGENSTPHELDQCGYCEGDFCEACLGNYEFQDQALCVVCENTMRQSGREFEKAETA